MAQTARDMYQSAVAKDEALRTAVAAGDRPPALREFRSVVAAYEDIVRRFPRSGYCDDALFKAAALAKLAAERFGDLRDKRTAVRLFKMLIDEYPTSSLVAGARSQIDQLDPARQLLTPTPQSPATLGVSTPPGHTSPPPGTRLRQGSGGQAATSTTAGPSATTRQPDTVVLRSITRTLLPGTVRISMELDREVLFEQARIDNPSRVFVDLKGTIPAPTLVDAVLTYTGDLVTQVRLGRHPGPTTRVVVDAEGITRYSIFALYEPFRLVIDCEHAVAEVGRIAPPVAPELLTAQPLKVDVLARAGLPRLPPRVVEMPAVSEPAAIETPAAPSPPSPPAPIPSKAAAPPVVTTPLGPVAKPGGGYSLARQLGLGASRIVIDPGHGGRDPGAKIRGLTEADVVLDISLRLERLLKKERGVEVVLTRRRNVFVPLER
ncbi:MAG: N-acetylmuramoyl-L-alanine amidase, partial [Acidobacteria bacterium]|nr:N-acetylmuramoyl-L-alanine amidase [Acidobacteriota bacterium]